MGEASLYDRLGGVFAIAAVIEKFSDASIGLSSGLERHEKRAR